MKVYMLLYITLSVLFSSLVLAEEGNIKVYSFKAYSNDEPIPEVSWSDTEFNVDRGTTLEMQIRLQNDYNQSGLDVVVTGVFYDINNEDITREKTVEDMDADEKKTAVLEYFIPESTNAGTYDLEIKYQYDAYDYSSNTTKTYKHTKTFNIDIIKKVIDPLDVLTNITQHLSDEKGRTNELLSTVLSTTNLTLRLDECRNELNNERLEGEFKSKYESELNTSRDNENKVTTCNAEKQNMYSLSQVDSFKLEAENKAKMQQKKEDDNFLLMAVVVFLIYNHLKKKKETVGGKGVAVPLSGARW